MVIFSLLIALLLDRATRNRGHWQLKPIAESWHSLLSRYTQNYNWARDSVLAPFIWIAPALLLGWVVWLQGSALLTLVVNVVVLLVVLGSAPKREFIRLYLQKAHAECAMDCAQVKAELDAVQPELAGAHIGAHIVWLNFRYYFAVAVCFIVLGVAGALVYALLREFVLLNNEQLNDELLNGEQFKEGSEDTSAADIANTDKSDFPASKQKPFFIYALYWIEWLPVRLAGLAYLLVGHFSRGLTFWLKGLADVTTPHSRYLTRVATEAEDTCSQPEGRELTDIPCAMLTLVKRSMMLLLAATALATLLGWLS